MPVNSRGIVPSLRRLKNPTRSNTMNSRLILTLVPLAGLILAGCDKPAPAPASAPAPPPKAAQVPATPPAAPVPAGPSETELKLQAQIQAMQDQQAEMQRRMDEEKLARLEAEIEKERALLEKEREAWRLEQELADARAAKEAPPSSAKSPRAKEVPSVSYQTGGDYSYQTFYDDLAPYGSWYESPDYGYVWQPSVYMSDSSWRPYTRGSWANCDAGWAWVSEEPFGWACYHYGRWAQCRNRGWIWVPGDQWAPAWVSWRKNDDYVGWCPLPPETVYHREVTWGVTIDTDCGIHSSWYTFVPVRHFDKPVLGYCEPPANCVRICSSTVNITNIVCRPDRVQCYGPKYDWIRQCVNRPVPQYTLAYEHERPAHGRPMHRLEDKKLHCFAPKVDVPWNKMLRPNAKVAVMEQTEVIRAESGLSAKVKDQYRAQKAQREQVLASTDNRALRQMVERQQKLAQMEQARQQLHAVPEKSQAVSGKRPVPPVASVVSQPGGDTVQPGTAVAKPAPATAPPTNPKEARAAREAAMRQQEIENARAREQAQQPPVPQTRPAVPSPAEEQRGTAEQAAQELAAKQAADAAAADGKSRNVRYRMEEQRRQIEQARAQEKAAADQAAAAKAQQDAAARAAEQQRQMDEAARAAAAKRNEAAAKELENQKALRAQIEEQRRGQAGSGKDRATAERAAAEQQNHAREESAAKDRARAAAMEEQRAREQAQQAQERASAQREAMENQRRQAEAARANEQAARQREEAMSRQREAAEQQRRQAEAAARERAMEQQREQQRRVAEENAARQREAMDRQREAAEQQRRAAEEAAARQREAAEQARRQAEESARESSGRDAKGARR